MNKKVLGIAVVLLAVAMLATPLVSAKPSAEKNNPKFLDFVLHVEFAVASDSYPSEWRLNPPSLMDDMGDPPYDLAAIPAEACVLFVKNRMWVLPTLPFPVQRYVTIGDVNIDLQPSDFYCLYDVTWVYGDGAGGFGIYKLETTVTINSPEYTGTIEISSTEKTIIDMSQLAMIGKGTFEGHGVINGQNVKVSGERNVMIDLTFILPPIMEEKGTIQFLGNAP